MSAEDQEEFLSDSDFSGFRRSKNGTKAFRTKGLIKTFSKNKKLSIWRTIIPRSPLRISPAAFYDEHRHKGDFTYQISRF
jgi:hypothetical protein